MPANPQARGSKYQGDMAIRYRLAATDANVIATALHDFHGFMSKTCRQIMMLQVHLFLSIKIGVGIRLQYHKRLKTQMGHSTSEGIDLTICDSVTPSGNCLPILLYPYW